MTTKKPKLVTLSDKEQKEILSLLRRKEALEKRGEELVRLSQALSDEKDTWWSKVVRKYFEEDGKSADYYLEENGQIRREPVKRSRIREATEEEVALAKLNNRIARTYGSEA